MARSNKYTSLNFNDIYEKKKFTSNSSSSSSASSSSSPSLGKTALSNSRIHGHMLVLTRPTPKPISIPQPKPLQQNLPSPHSTLTSPSQARTEPEPEPDPISLRPQGRTGPSPGPGTSLSSSPVNPSIPLQSPLPKTDRFVPPHLRPGFAGREENPRDRVELGGGGQQLRQLPVGGSPNPYGEERRPKSGGGYERNRRGGVEVDPAHGMSRPGSSGAWPRSSD